MLPKQQREMDLRSRLAASFRGRARHIEKRLEGVVEGDPRHLTQWWRDLADRLETDEPVRVLGSDVEYLAGLRFQDLPDFVAISPEGEVT